MKLTKTRGLTGVLLFLFMIGLASCGDDNDLSPITLKYLEGSSISMFYRGEKAEYSYPLQGGDGIYSVQSGNNAVVTAEMISMIDLRLTVAGVGETIVTVTDNSHNTLVLNIQVDYETHNMKIVHHDVSILGDDLTGNEKKAIREEQLAQMPVKVGGGYKFIYSDASNNKGKAIIYPETYGSNGIETVFEQVRVVKDEYETWGYEIMINNEKRIFILDRYSPSENSLRSEMVVPIALKEDVTAKVQAKYPKAEFVYTSQVVEREPY